jgi:hypothetical protein
MMIISMIAVRVRLGDSAKYVSIPYVGVVIGVTLSAAATYFLWAAILFGVSKAFSKNQEITFASLLTIVGGKALYDIIIKVVGIILFLILPGVGFVVLVLGNTFASVLMLVTYCETIDLAGSKKVYAVSITYVCAAIVSGLIMLITLGSVFSELMSSVVNMFSDLM